LIDVLRVMDSAGVHHLPVVEDGRCVGLPAEIDMLGMGSDAVLVLDGDRVAGIVTASDLAVSLVGPASAATWQRS
jgi:CBS domain-containing protein